MTSHEPLTRALDALQYLYTPEMDGVALAAWQEVRDAILEAQAQHRTAIAALEEPASGEGEAKASAVPGGQAASELLQELELYPDQPRFSGMRE